MIYTYENYRGLDRWISIEDCQRIHLEIEEEMGDDPEAAELYDELIETCIDYSGMRSSWTIHDADWRNAHDSTRTIYHDSVITAMNVLARFLRMNGKTAAWRDFLGNNEKGPDRKRVGDFACYLVYIHGINGR